MLVGEFTHDDGSRYVMIVNKNLTASVTPKPELGEQIWLAPGQGLLLKTSKP